MDRVSWVWALELKRDPLEVGFDTEGLDEVCDYMWVKARVDEHGKRREVEFVIHGFVPQERLGDFAKCWRQTARKWGQPTSVDLRAGNWKDLPEHWVSPSVRNVILFPHPGHMPPCLSSEDLDGYLKHFPGTRNLQVEGLCPDADTLPILKRRVPGLRRLWVRLGRPAHHNVAVTQAPMRIDSLVVTFDAHLDGPGRGITRKQAAAQWMAHAFLPRRLAVFDQDGRSDALSTVLCSMPPQRTREMDIQINNAQEF